MVQLRTLLCMSLAAAVKASDFSDLPPACDNIVVSIANQTILDFYKKNCPIIEGGTTFGPDHAFKGPFVLPNVVSVPSLTAGYQLPKSRDREDDRVTSISMPDLKKITGTVLLGYLDNLKSISLPKLESVGSHLTIEFSDGLKDVSLPSLKTIGGAATFDGDFDSIDLPKLESAMFLRIVSTGNISCAALGAKYASLKYADKLDKLFEPYRGFTCSTTTDGNVWPKPDGSATTASLRPTDPPTMTRPGGSDGGAGGAGGSKTSGVSGGNEANPTESSGAGSKKDDAESGAAMLRSQYGYMVLALVSTVWYHSQYST